jgi:hypothetical protein
MYILKVGVLLNAKWVSFELYHGKNKLQWVSFELYHGKNKLQWVSFELYHNKNKLQWVSFELYHDNNKLQKRNYVMQLYNYWLAVIHVYFNVNVFERFESLEDKTMSVSLGCVIIKLV